MALSLIGPATYDASSRIRRVTDALSGSIAKLSSGNRITHAKDDVASMSISTRMSTKLSALRIAAINVAQADSMLQVADDALSGITEITQRMAALALQANSGSVSASDRGFLNIEFQQLKNEIESHVEETRFNDIQLFRNPVIANGNGDATTYTETLFNPLHLNGVALWLDGDDPTQIELSYVTNGLGGAQANGVAGSNTVTTTSNVSARLEVGARIRLGAAGATTTADTMGTDTYTIAGIAGNVITTAESLSTNYANATFRTGMVRQWKDKSGDDSHALQNNAAQMPLWVSASEEFDGNGSLRFFDNTRSNMFLTPDLNNAAGGYNSVFFTLNWHPGNSQMPFGFTTYDLWASSTNHYGFNTGGGNVYGIDPTPLLSNTTHQQTANFYNGSMQDNVSLYIDGEEQNINFIRNGNGNRTVSDSMRISSWVNNTSYTIDGEMSEYIILDDLADDTTRALLEQYQSAKWGISSSSYGTDPVAPGVSTDGFSVARTASSGTLVGALTENLGDAEVTYRITDGDPQGMFSINSEGEITVRNAGALGASSANAFVLTVEVDLGGDEPMELAVNISVGAGTGSSSGGFNFQIGAETSHQLNIQIGEVFLEDIFTDPDINILTSESAETAFNVVDAGIDYITEKRAYIGSKQVQAEYISNSVIQQIQQQDAARAVIADTDIVRVSTEFAQQQLQQNMSIAIAAQTNQLNRDYVLGIMSDAVLNGRELMPA